MYLKRLEIQGFKSFARKSTFEYERGITAIVGPNGSGKSNVADSLRWVLGEQSAKLIRGKKSDDVIFAGSDMKVRAGYAEVIATFDNRDHKIPLDAAEVSIGRRIDRTGESEYLINGARVRLLDVIDLVLKSNIGTSRYTVIGQGTIDNMILSGPVEIKNLIDEASGVKTYYIRREKTLRRLEQTVQNLMRAEDLISELEPRVKSLRRQAKRMEAREVIEVELKGYLREHLGGTYWLLKTKADALHLELSALQTHRAQVESSMASHLLKLEQHEKENSEQLSKFASDQMDLQALQGQKNGLLENLSMIRGKMQGQGTFGSQDSSSLKVLHHNLEQQAIDLRTQITAAKGGLSSAQARGTEQKQALATLSEQFTAVYESLQHPSSTDWKALNEQLLVIERGFSALYNSIENSDDINSIRTEAGQLKVKWNEFSQAIQTASEQPNTDQAHLQFQMQELSVQKDKLTADLNSINVQGSKAEMALTFLTRQLQKCEAELLQVQLDLQKSESSSTDDFVSQMLSQSEAVQKQVDAVQQKIVAKEGVLKKFYDEENSWKNSISDEDKLFRQMQSDANSLRDQESVAQVEKAKLDTQAEAVIAEIHQSLGSAIASEIFQTQIVVTTQDLADKISKLKHQLELAGGVDELTIQEYRETEARYTGLVNQVDDLKKSMDDLRSVMDELDGHIKTQFNDAFHKVNEQFENYFRVLFNGGRAYMTLLKSGKGEDLDASEQSLDQDGDETASDGLRPEEKIVAKYEQGGINVSGVDIRATPPGKKLATIQALSGGERALTSIALLCSLLTCFPSPFVVLDEVDAALDESNTIRFGQILGTLSHQTQFITITHNRETMAQSNTLYGVTMGDDGISKLLSIKLEQAKTFAK